MNRNTAPVKRRQYRQHHRECEQATAGAKQRRPRSRTGRAVGMGKSSQFPPSLQAGREGALPGTLSCPHTGMWGERLGLPSTDCVSGTWRQDFSQCTQVTLSSAAPWHYLSCHSDTQGSHKSTFKWQRKSPGDYGSHEQRQVWACIFPS